MKFFDIGKTLQTRINTADIRPFVEIAFDLDGDGSFWAVPTDDVLECKITEDIESTGGVVHRGMLVLDNTNGDYNPERDSRLKPALQVRITYCLGERFYRFNRFTLYVDGNGFQTTGTEFTSRTCTVGLADYSRYLKETDRARDWTAPFTAVHCAVCDKGNPAGSLVHLIASRAGLTAADIDCGYLPFEIDYVEITKNVWAELSLLARAYRAHLECGAGMPLTFAYSPYEAEAVPTEESSFFTLTENDVIHFRRFDRADEYKNTLRLKWNRFAAIGRTELWRYSDAPVLYDEHLQPRYPFAGGRRDIEKYENYEAVYSVRMADGKTLTVVYAEDVDSREVFEGNLRTESGAISVVKYDTTTLRDRAVVQLAAGENTVMTDCVIYGKAIVVQPNFCHFIKNENFVLTEGVRAENVTNKYLSGTVTEGVPFYELWAADTLADLSKKKKGYFVKTNRAVFHARAGAYVCVDLSESYGIFEAKAAVNEFCLRYKKDAAFETTFWLSSV